MTKAVYPQSILPWLDREDEIDVVFANDPNSLAADLVAVENTLGVMPQVMNYPIVGAANNFGSVDQRMDYITLGGQIPVAQLSNPATQVPNRQGSGAWYGVYNSYTADYDPFGMWNGSDITAPVTGWYDIQASQLWNWWSTGYNALHLIIGNTRVWTDKWQWDFTGNTAGSYWQAEGNTAREGFTGVSWSGVVSQGARIRTVSENGTSNTPFLTLDQSMSVKISRTTPPNNNFNQTIPILPATGTAGIVSVYPAPSGLSVTNQTGGQIQVNWTLLTKPTPIPVSYTVAVYDTSTNALVALTSIRTPQSGVTAGTGQATITDLPTGASYQVQVWGNGGLMGPQHAIANISLPS